MKIEKKIRLQNINKEWLANNLAEKDNFGYLLFKILTDIFFGFFGLVFFILLLPVLAILIKFDSPGGVIFKQERVGKNGKKFLLYKFRTMHQDENKNSNLWREKDKQSITRTGRFLRRLHLDELPQALNLLKGEISFIGPRAEWSKLSEIFEAKIPFYAFRYLVRPGVIGWAQINFPPSRSLKEAQEKFEYDLYYIKNRSLLLDLEIILKAVKLFSW